MALSESQFRMGVLGGAGALAIAMTVLRFCGDVALPPKPAPPVPRGSSSQLVDKSKASATVYEQILARDANTAGLAVPTLETMSRELPYTAFAERTVLAVGDKPLAAAGLTLTAVRVDDALALSITNESKRDLAYRVVTQVTPSGGKCIDANPIGGNAMVIAGGVTVTRAECGFRSERRIVILGVETLEVPPLAAWYLGQVPPEVVGIETRIARQHVGVQTRDRCSPIVGQALKTMIETGKITWRDLADFYARHRCQTYSFPLDYRAITANSPRAIPAVRESP